MQKERISVVIPKELLEESEELAKKRMEDRSTIIRQLIAEGLKHEKIRNALEMYSERKISLEKAAEMGGISIWGMFDLLRERMIPLKYGKEDAEKEIKGLIG